MPKANSILSPLHVGRLNASFQKWKNTGANSAILNVISSRYKLHLLLLPKASVFNNNRSAVHHAEFVDSEIQKLLQLKCISKVEIVPKVINPLIVAESRSGKLRMVLDCRHVNLCLHKFKHRHENVITVRHLFGKGDFTFIFDLKSAYHHNEIFDEQKQYLGFAWRTNYYVFSVLPFGLSTSGFIFDKVMRHLVKFWHAQGIRLIMY